MKILYRESDQNVLISTTYKSLLYNNLFSKHAVHQMNQNFAQTQSVNVQNQNCIPEDKRKWIHVVYISGDSKFYTILKPWLYYSKWIIFHHPIQWIQKDNGWNPNEFNVRQYYFINKGLFAFMNVHMHDCWLAWFK